MMAKKRFEAFCSGCGRMVHSNPVYFQVVERQKSPIKKDRRYKTCETLCANCRAVQLKLYPLWMVVAERIARLPKAVQNALLDDCCSAIQARTLTMERIASREVIDGE